MASVIREIELAAPAEVVWSAICDFGAVHTRLAPGFVIDSRMEDGVRVMTFANGAVAREIQVARDDAHRRLSYAAVGGQASHHNASVQVYPSQGGGCRLVWITDVLPDAFAGYIEQMMTLGAAAIQRHMAKIGQS